MPISAFEESDRQGPWNQGPAPGRRDEDEPRGREPIFNNGVWYVLALVVVILGGYALQERLPQAAVGTWVFAPVDLTQGRWWTAVTAVFLHGSWTHALFNAGFILAFGTPTARFLGLGARGALAFLAFYVLTGALANVAFAAIHWGSTAGLVGASGAASALMASAARIVAGRGQGLGPVTDRFVISMGGAWIAINLLIALIMLYVGGELLPGAGGAGIAWEAHLAGFALGLVLISPFARLARR